MYLNFDVYYCVRMKLEVLRGFVCKAVVTFYNFETVLA